MAKPKFAINLDLRRFAMSQARAAFAVMQKRDGIEAPEIKDEPVHREGVRVKGTSTPDRRRHYLRQPGGKRIHILGSEGGLTGPQARRLKHKMGHRKQLAAKRRTKV